MSMPGLLAGRTVQKLAGGVPVAMPYGPCAHCICAAPVAAQQDCPDRPMGK